MMGETGEIWAEGKKRRQESVGSVDVNSDDPDNGKEAQGAQGLSTNDRDLISHLSRLIRGFRNKYNSSSLGRTNNASGME